MEIQLLSIEDWEKEVRNILDGKREYILQKIGNAAEYIDILIRQSSDKALTETIFHKAFENFLTSWQSDKIYSDYYLDKFFELVMDFLPPGGYTKIYSFLAQWNIKIEDAEGNLIPANEDLIIKALNIFEKYLYLFKKTIESNEVKIQYRDGVELLFSYLEHSRYMGIITGILITLDELVISDNRVLNTLKSNHLYIMDILRCLFNKRPTNFSKKLSYLIQHAIEAGISNESLIKYFKTMGAELNFDAPDGILIRYRNTETRIMIPKIYTDFASPAQVAYRHTQQVFTYNEQLHQQQKMTTN